MTLDRFEVRISLTKLLLALIIIVLPISVFGLYLTERSDKALDRNIGTDFRTIAELYSNNVSEFVRDRVAEVTSMAADPAIAEAVSQAGRGYGSGNEDSANDKINKIVQGWNTAEGEGAVKKVLYSSASEALRKRKEFNPHFLRIIATDEHGAVVAATQKPAKYSYADDIAWRATYASGQGAPSIGNILFDQLRKAYYTDFGVPIFDPASSRFVGVMIATADVSGLLSQFQQAQVGNGARALLVNEEGSILSGPKVDVFARMKSDEFGAIRDSLGSLQGRQTGYVVADLNAGRRVIGFADTGLKQHYQNLGWIVLVSQEERLAAAPMRDLEKFALLMVVLGLLSVTLVGVYYYLHRAEKYSDIEDVLPRQAVASAGR